MASNSRLPIELAQHVAAAINGATLRRGISEDVVMFTTALSAELEFVAQAYTGCPNTKEMVWDECMDFVVVRFGMLNIHELRHAFRLAASGELGDVNLKAYYGTFTVGMLGEVLTSYLERRKALSIAARSIQNRDFLIEHGNSKRSSTDVEAFKDNRHRLLLLLESPSIDMVTVYDYEFLTERGVINLTPDQKWSVFESAKAHVIHDLTAQAYTAGYFVSKALHKEIALAKANTPSPDFVVRQKIIAQRMSVLNWIASKRSN